MKALEIVLIILIVISAIFLFINIGTLKKIYGNFEYTTTSGETGTAKICVVEYGQARCRTDDNRIIMVESYEIR